MALQWKPARERRNWLLHLPKHSTIWICYALHQGSENWNSPSFFRCFAPCPAFLWAEKLSCSVVLPPKNAQTSIGRHFFFKPLISHCLKSQLSNWYEEKTLLGAATSLEVTFPRVSLRGRHFANVGDDIIYPDLVVARTAGSSSGRVIAQGLFRYSWKLSLKFGQWTFCHNKFLTEFSRVFQPYNR